MIHSELIDYLNAGDFSDIRRCYDAIATSRWGALTDEGWYQCDECYNSGTSRSPYKTINKTETDKIYRKAKPYSRRCATCGHVESPTAHTLLEHLDLRAFLSTLHGIWYQGTIKKRISEIDIVKHIKQRYKQKIGERTIERYRKLIQPYLPQYPYHYFAGQFVEPFLIHKFWIEDEKDKKLIILNFPAGKSYVRGFVYDQDNWESLRNVLINTPACPEIRLINWDKSYDEIKSFALKVKPCNMDMADMEHDIVDWMKGVEELSSNEESLMHLNECLFFLYYCRNSNQNVADLLGIMLAVHYFKKVVDEDDDYIPVITTK